MHQNIKFTDVDIIPYSSIKISLYQRLKKVLKAYKELYIFKKHTCKTL